MNFVFMKCDEQYCSSRQDGKLNIKVMTSGGHDPSNQDISHQLPILVFIPWFVLFLLHKHKSSAKHIPGVEA